MMFPEENWFDGGIGPQIFPNFFWSCYSSSLDLESSVATHTSHIIKTQNTKQNLFLIITARLNQNRKIRGKKKRVSRSDPVWRWGGGRGAAAW